MFIVLAFPVLLLLLLKILEMATQCFFMGRHGYHSNQYDLTNMPITRTIEHWRWVSPFFRLHYLITASAIILLFQLVQGYLAIIFQLLILAAIWVQLLQALMTRLIFGYTDIFFRRKSVWGNSNVSDQNIDKQQLVTEFFLFFGGFIYVVAIGYAAVYSAIQHIDDHAFNASLGFWDVIYFSVVTLATVGYGDILPLTTVARIVTTSEISVGVGSLVLLITAYSVTAQADPQQGGSQAS